MSVFRAECPLTTQLIASPEGDHVTVSEDGGVAQGDEVHGVGDECRAHATVGQNEGSSGPPWGCCRSHS